MPGTVLGLLSFPSRCLRASRLRGWTLVTAISASAMLVPIPETRGVRPEPGGMRGVRDLSVREAQGKDTCNPGDLDPGFGTGGVVTSNPSERFDRARAIAIDSSFMYVIGSNEVGGFRDSQWWIEKRSLVDGSLDRAFGTAGEVTSNPSEGADSACQIAIDSSFMYVVGTDESSDFGQWRIEKRTLKDGSLHAPFGTGGVVTSDPISGKRDGAYGIAIDSSFMYVTGDDQSLGGGQWRIEKRCLTDGSLDCRFGTEGAVSSDLSPSHGFPNDIVVDSSFVYVGGLVKKPDSSDIAWRIEKRRVADGSLDTGFGVAGAVATDPSAKDAGIVGRMIGIAVDSDFLYVIGSDRSQGASDAQWRIEKRKWKDGSLDPSFGKRGVVTSNPSEGADHPWAMAIDGTFLYVAGCEEVSAPSDRQWRIEKRHLKDDCLDPSFGAGGAVISNPSPQSDTPGAMAVDSSFLYVVGHGWSRMPNKQRRSEKRCK